MITPRIGSALLLSLFAFMPVMSQAGMTPDEVKKFEVYKVKAEKGDAYAQHNLGVFYYYGVGTEKNWVEAVKWYRKAAQAGIALAQFNLGCCCLYGNGVEKDEVEAVKWIRKAAEQGVAEAQVNLGSCLYQGKGVAKDEIEAYAYFNLAGVTLEVARTNLAEIEKAMSPDARLLGQQRTKQLRKEIEGRLESAEEIRKAIEKERSKGA